MSKPKSVRFEFLDVNVDVVKIHDCELSVVADVYFRKEGVYCSACKFDACPHIDYALTVPIVRKEVMKKIKAGWNLPEPDL